MTKKIFGAYVKKRRQAQKYTQEELASLLSVSVSTIKNIESGRFYPNCDKLFSLIEILDISIDSLMSKPHELSSIALPEEINNKIASLPDASKNQFFTILEQILDSLLKSE